MTKQLLARLRILVASFTLVLVASLALPVISPQVENNTPATASLFSTQTAYAAEDCPETGWVSGELGISITKVTSEVCSFAFNTGVKTNFIPVRLAPGFVTTTAREPDGTIYVQYGDGNTVNAGRGTFRWAKSYSPELKVESEWIQEWYNGTAATQLPNFEGVVKCIGCNIANVPANTPSGDCPLLGSIWTQSDGNFGCVYYGPNLESVTLPAGYWAYFGSPPHCDDYTMSGIHGTLYKKPRTKPIPGC